MNISYERVSTLNQDEKRQEIILDIYNIEKKYVDHSSGKNLDRPQLNKLMLEAKKDDNIYVESISRLGRNVDDLRSLTQYFKEKGSTIHFVKEGFNTNGNMYKFLITILGAVSEMERELIVERVKEGMIKAKKHGTKTGVPIGRPPRKLPNNFEKYYEKWKRKKITGVEFSKLIKVSKSTLYRYIKDFENGLFSKL